MANDVNDLDRLRAQTLLDAAEFLRGVDMPEAADLLENLAYGWAPRALADAEGGDSK